MFEHSQMIDHLGCAAFQAPRFYLRIDSSEMCTDGAGDVLL